MSDCISNNFCNIYLSLLFTGIMKVSERSPAQKYPPSAIVCVCVCVCVGGGGGGANKPHVSGL